MSKGLWLRLRRRTARILTLTVLVAGAAALVTVGVARANPGCQDGGVLMIGVRGSQNEIQYGSQEVMAFYYAVQRNLEGVPSSTVELGDFDNDKKIDAGEYPAVGPKDWGIFSGMDGYNASVNVGADELRNFLNSRYLNGQCSRETVVIGGYSQGAEVAGYAITGLGELARRHVAYVALYGDPRNNANCVQGIPAYWVKGNAGCVSGFLGARVPYLPADFQYKTGSWCDQSDGVCTGRIYNVPLSVNFSTHNGPYEAYANGSLSFNGWIAQSGPTVARAALGKLVELNPWLGDWNHDAQPDFFAFNKRDGGSGKTVYFVCNGVNPAQMLQVGATPFGWTDNNWTFSPGYDFNHDGTPELYAFNKHGNGHTDYAVLNGRDPGGPAVQAGPTAFGWTGDSYLFTSGPDWNHDSIPDLYAFDRQDGGSGHTVLFVMDGRDPTQFLQISVLPFGWTDSNWSFAPGQDWNGDGMWDIYAFNKRDVGSGKTVYFVMNGRDPGQFLQIGATAFGWTGDNYSFMPGPDWNHDGRPDLYAFDKHDGGSGHTVYFVMNGRDPAQFLQVGALPFGWTDNAWQFGVFNG